MTEGQCGIGPPAGTEVRERGVFMVAKYSIPELPGPVSDGCEEVARLCLKQRLAKAALEICSGEAPREGFGEGGVASAESVDSFCELGEAGAVIRGEHFTLNDREVNFN